MFETEVLFFICGVNISTLHLAYMDINVVVCAFYVIFFKYSPEMKLVWD